MFAYVDSVVYYVPFLSAVAVAFAYFRPQYAQALMPAAVMPTLLWFVLYPGVAALVFIIDNRWMLIFIACVVFVLTRAMRSPERE